VKKDGIFASCCAISGSETAFIECAYKSTKCEFAYRFLVYQRLPEPVKRFVWQVCDAEVLTTLIVRLAGIPFAVVVCEQGVDCDFNIAISSNVNLLVWEVSRLAVACNTCLVNGGQYRYWRRWP
jgi:hypothetical protein